MQQRGGSPGSPRFPDHPDNLNTQPQFAPFAVPDDKAELVDDVPIVGLSSLENDIGPSVAGARGGLLTESVQEMALGVNGCAPVKRERSQQELEEARAEKRIKVHSNGGLPSSFVGGIGLDPTFLHGSVEDSRVANPGGELVKERDDLRPWLRGPEISASAAKDTDLTDLLHDLDDAGDSDPDDDDDEFGDGSHLWPEAVCDEWLGIGSVNLKGIDGGVLAHTPQVEIIAKALNVSSEQVRRVGEIGSTVQARPLPNEPITEAPGSSSDQAQCNGEIESTVKAHSLQLEATTKAPVFSAEQAQSHGDVGSMVQPETITEAPLLPSEQAQSNGEVGATIQSHSSQPETVPESQGFSSEQAQGDDETETVVREEGPAPCIVILDSDSDEDEDDDDGFIMFDHPVESSPFKNVVKVEPGAGKLEKSITQLQDTVKTEPEMPRPPEKSSQFEGVVKVEQEILRQPDKSSPLRNAVKVEPEVTRQPSRNFQPKNTLKVEPENLRPPDKSSQLGTAVKAEPENLRRTEERPEFVPTETSEPRESSNLAIAVNSERDNMGQAADTVGIHGFQAPTVHRPGQELRGFLLETVVQDGKLMWALVPQNPDTTLGSPYAAHHMHPAPPQVHGVPNGLPNGLPYRLGCSPGFVHPNVRSCSSSGEQAGPSHGWGPPPTSSADVPSYSGHAEPSGMGNCNHAVADQAAPSVPSPPQPSVGVENAAASREQAGPSHDWTPPVSSAVVPFRYDTTVSSPRVEVTRALQNYLISINKAKCDRAREASSSDFVREGNRRGLECRPDIVAYNEIKRANLGANPGVNVGDLPGVEVGDTFTYRHQMAVVGLHRLPNVGIDYGRPPPDMIPTATAIVMMPKAGYVDDRDCGNLILYTGQGGRKKRNQQAPFICDQKLTKGNLALAKNYERKLPVRVIRGHFGIGPHGPGFLGYSYDGLYAIVSYELGDGINGFKVYKYHMERLEDQPPIPACIAGCSAHDWNTHRKAVDVAPLQAKDPTEEDVKPFCMQDVPEDVKPLLLQEPLVEMKQICT